MQLTEKIAAFVEQANYGKIPELALQQAKTGIMDWIFVSLVGAKQATGSVRNFTGLIMGKGGRTESTIVGTMDKATENQAAMINGCIGHLLDYDETCPLIRSHLFASIFPALLAAAESREASGKALLTGFIVGHEVAMRVGEAITPAWIKAGWHGTSLFGIFGAAAGCAKLMGLKTDQIKAALGLAASMAGGVAVNFGSMAKPLHAGMAAERGLFAAQLAQSGFTANQGALEGALGFYHAYNWGQPADEAVFDRLGNPWGLETPGMSAIKLYPCCHGLATNIECGVRVHHRDGLQLKDIEAVEIHSQPKTLCAMLSREYEDTGRRLEWGYQGPPRLMKTILPFTGSQAKFSKEYAVSRALKDGRVGLADFTDEAVNEPEISRWMAKIKLFHNSEMEKYSNQYPEKTAPHAERMIVRLKNGRTIEEEEIFIRGMTKRPLSLEDVILKFHNCGAAAGLSEEKVDMVISLINKFEQAESVAELVVRIGG
jgi:2-methylcitrate dehydratase PrpD